jgi:hypothetical protein
MRHRIQIVLAVGVLAVLSLSAGGGEQIAAPAYEVAEVKRQLVREQPEPEERLEVGAKPVAGDLLRTGSRSSAEIVCPDHGARFLLASKTRARLAGDRPGILLEVERGSLRAIFAKFLGDGDPPDRIVTTPSAVLAVRGTEYGVEVSKAGDTTVTVFSGEVEVVDIARSAPPIRIRAGEFGTIRRDGVPADPRPHELSQKDWDRGQRPEDPTTRGGDWESGRGPADDGRGPWDPDGGMRGGDPGGSPGGSSPGPGQPQGGGSRGNRP